MSGKDELEELEEYKKLGDLRHLRKLIKAEQEERLVIFCEKRKPLVWGDKERDTILCPECGRDLMGRLPLYECSEIEMYQCPFCGCPIDECKALTPPDEIYELEDRRKPEEA